MTEFSEEETQQLVGMFRTLGVKPKTDSPDDLRKWMKDYLQSQNGAGAPPDVKQMVTSTVVTHNPRVSNFSGSTKGDHVSYDVWKYEVTSLLEEAVHSREAVTVAVRKSLKGEAANIAMHLGVKSTLDVLMDKLDGFFGTVEQSESLLAQFYSSSQRDTEDVASWACRIEDLLERAKRQRGIPKDTADEMLRQMFWTGLRIPLHEAARHKYDTVDTFNALVVVVRRIELEHHCRSGNAEDKSKMKTQSKAATTGTPKEQSELSELKGMINSLASSVKTMQEDMSSYRHGDTPSKKDQHSKYKGKGGQGNYRGGQKQGQTSGPETKDDSQSDIICWDCGESGHVKIGCRNQKKKNNPKHLNDNRPAHKGP